MLTIERQLSSLISKRVTEKKLRDIAIKQGIGFQVAIQEISGYPLANEDNNPGILLAFGCDMIEVDNYMRRYYPYPTAYTSMYIPTKCTLNEIDFGGAVKNRFVYLNPR